MTKIASSCFKLTFYWSILCSGVLFGQVQAIDVRAQLAAINYRQFNTLDEYIYKSKQVGDLLPRMTEFYQQGAETIKRLSQKHSGDPDFIKRADFYAALNAKDQEGLESLKQEVALSAEMSNLPVRRRQSFYDERIIPLHAKEDRIASEEINMALKARRKGIPLPDDVEKVISQ